MLIVSALLCFGIFGALANPIASPLDAKTDQDPKYRLPGNIVPTNYKIEIDASKFIDDVDKVTGKSKFTGKVTIEATVLEKLTKIRLSARAININKNNVQVLEATDPNKENIYDSLTSEEYDFVDIKLKKELDANKQVVITMEYDGILDKDMNGFYISSYMNDKNEIEYLATTQFQPTHARRAFPCFDEPQYKATFDLTIKKPQAYNAISNTNVKNANPTTIEFQRTEVMSTYLLAFIVSKFGRVDATDKRFGVWARPTARQQTEYAVKNGMRVAQELGKFTAIDYFQFMDKLDMAALPDFSAGAMENWGLLTYRETALLYDENMSTNRDKQRVLSVIVHEMAHQWFGDLVTTKWWDNTWLNEGFATYFEYHTTGILEPDWEMSSQFLIDEQQVVFDLDALSNTTPLQNKVNSPAEISAHFGKISYNKGGSIIRMMEHIVGSETFKKGLNRYLLANQFKNTVPADLFQNIEDQVQADKVDLKVKASVVDIMTPWVEQPGYPVVTVSKDNDKFTFSQKRFLITPDDTDKNTWFIPISYITSKNPENKDPSPTFWLKKSDSEISETIKDADWLIVNVMGAGYYRVNYSKDLWEKISDALRSDDGKKIHQLNKAQLIDDVMNLARSGHVDYEIAFKVAGYLKEEDNYFVWRAAFQSFRFLLQRFDDQDETGKNIREYLLDLMETLLKDKDFNGDDKDSKQIDVFNRASALEWACNLEHEKCVDDATAMFKEFMDKNTAIPKNLKSIVYCSALRKGGEKEYNHLWDVYKSSNVAAEKITILNSLGCSNEKKVLEKYLDESLKSDVREQDAAYVFTSVYTGNSQGVEIAFEFLKKHHKEIATKYGGMNALGNAIIGLSSRFTKKEQLDNLKAFLKDNADDLKDVKVIAEAAIEKSEESILWADKFSSSITDVLKSAGAAINSSIMCITFGLLVIYTKIFV